MTPKEKRRAEARDYIDRLPDSIRVGVFDMAVVKLDLTTTFERKVWGEFSQATQEIRIQSDMPTKQKAVDTFLHELLHAIYWAAGLEDEDKEERTVSTMASWIAGVFRDNPRLLDWLKGGLT